MSCRVVPEPRTPQTRREIREAERARKGGLLKTLANTSHQLTARLTESATRPAPTSVAGIVGDGHAAPAAHAVATEMLAITVGPQRRDLREDSPRGGRLRTTPRAAMAGTLAALAILTPIVGTSGLTDGAVAATGEGSTVSKQSDAGLASTAASESEALRADQAVSRAADRQALEAAQAAEEAQKAAEAEQARQAAEAEQARQAAEAAAAEQARQAAEAAAAANRVVLPLDGGSYSLTSSYGGRNDPMGRGSAYSFHLGQDMAAPQNTPIRAAAAGTVIHAGAGIDGRSSNLIIIEHHLQGQTFYTWYVHMYDDGVYVAPGQQVAAGDVIGGVGSNGNSTGPHLHFEVHDAANNTIEPLAWLQQHGAA